MTFVLYFLVSNLTKEFLFNSGRSRYFVGVLNYLISPNKSFRDISSLNLTKKVIHINLEMPENYIVVLE